VSVSSPGSCPTVHFSRVRWIVLESTMGRAIPSQEIARASIPSTVTVVN